MNEKIIQRIKKPTLKSSVGFGSIIIFLNLTLLGPPSKGGYLVFPPCLSDEVEGGTKGGDLRLRKLLTHMSPSSVLP